MTLQEQNTSILLFHRNNVWWAYLIGFAGAALGSGLSILVVVTFIWALYSVITQQFTFALSKANWTGALISAFYGMVILVFTVAQNGLDALLPNIGLLLFLAPLFMIPRLYLSEPYDVMRALFVGSAVGVIIITVPALISLYLGLARTEVLAGNANIFGSMVALFGTLGGLCLMLQRRWEKWLGAIALIAMLLALLSSGMRSMWLITPILLAIVGWAVSSSFKRKHLWAVTAALLIIGGAISLIAGDAIGTRFSKFSTDIHKMVEDGNYKSSTGYRILMLEGGFRAFLDDPLTGYGIEERINSVKRALPEDKSTVLPDFNHAHNGFLTAALDAGILGVLSVIALVIFSPIQLIFEKKEDHIWRMRMAACLILTSVYFAAGMTNILFQHDIMDSAFVALFTILLATGGTKEWKFSASAVRSK